MKKLNLKVVSFMVCASVICSLSIPVCFASQTASQVTYTASNGNIKDFEMYHGSSNIQSFTSTWVDLFENPVNTGAVTHAEGATGNSDSSYVLFKAREGSKFKSVSIDTVFADVNARLKAYAYDDIIVEDDESDYTKVEINDYTSYDTLGIEEVSGFYIRTNKENNLADGSGIYNNGCLLEPYMIDPDENGICNYYFILKLPEDKEIKKFDIDLGRGAVSNGITRVSFAPTLDGNYTEISPYVGKATKLDTTTFDGEYFDSFSTATYRNIPVGSRYVKVELLNQTQSSFWAMWYGKMAYYYETPKESTPEIELSEEYALSATRRFLQYSNEWSNCYNYTFSMLPENAKYIKIVLPEGNSSIVHANNFTFTMIPEEEVLYSEETYTDEFDYEAIDSDYFLDSFQNVALYSNSLSGVGDGKYLAVETSYGVEREDSSSVTFRAPPGFKYKHAVITSCAQGSNARRKFIKFETSSDGTNFYNVPTEKNFTYKNWIEIEDKLSTLPADTRYIRITFPKNMIDCLYVDRVQFSWVNDDIVIDEMPYEEYASINLSEPSRPEIDVDTATFTNTMEQIGTEQIFDPGIEAASHAERRILETSGLDTFGISDAYHLAEGAPNIKYICSANYINSNGDSLGHAYWLKTGGIPADCALTSFDINVKTPSSFKVYASETLDGEYVELTDKTVNSYWRPDYTDYKRDYFTSTFYIPTRKVQFNIPAEKGYRYIKIQCIPSETTNDWENHIIGKWAYSYAKTEEYEENDLLFNDWENETVIMAPIGKKISQLTYSVKSGGCGKPMFSVNYTDGFIESSATSNGNLYTVIPPANTIYAKLTGNIPDEITVSYASQDDEIASSAIISSSRLADAYSDRYIVDYKGISTVSDNYIPLESSVSASYDGAVCFENENSYITIAAPDNSIISEGNIVIYSETDVAPIIKVSDRMNGEYSSISPVKTKLDDKFFMYQFSNANCRFIKIQGNVAIKLLKYEFLWNGTPVYGQQGMGEYTLSIDNSERKQSMKGWGVFPAYEPEFALENGKELYSELGADILRFELYGDVDSEGELLISSDGGITSKINSVVNHIELAKRFKKEYMLTIWSPPASMKTNGKIWGLEDNGSAAYLKAGCEEAFVQFIVDALVYIEEQTGTKPVGFSFANEPPNTTNYQSCAYTKEQLRNVLILLDEALDNAGFGDVMILSPETNTLKGVGQFIEYDWSWLNTDEGKAVDAVIYHAYDDKSSNHPDDMIDEALTNLSRVKPREIWQTEYCTISISDGERFANETLQKINHDTQHMGVSRWFYWNGVISGESQETLINVIDGERDVKKEYYLLRALYNNVPKGSTVIDADINDPRASDCIDVSTTKSSVGAFDTPDGCVATIANTSDFAKTYTVTGLEGDRAMIYLFNGTSNVNKTVFCDVTDGAIHNLVLEAYDCAVIVCSDEVLIDVIYDSKESTVKFSIDNNKIDELYQNPKLIKAVYDENKLEYIEIINLTDIENVDIDEGKENKLFVWDIDNIYPIYHKQID